MVRQAFLLAVASLLAIGCRQSPYMSAHLELMNAERRALEDRVFDLQYDLEQAEHELELCRSKHGESADDEPEDVDPGSPTIVIPEGGQIDIPELGPPQIDEGTPTTPDFELPAPNGAAAGAEAGRRLADRRPPAGQPTSTRSAAPAPGDPRITHIALNASLTGGGDFDKRPGDDGIVVVLEPRNRANQFVPLAGPVAIVLLDYAKRSEGAAAYVARWDLDAQAVDKALRNDDVRRGIHLELPWPDRPPENSRLRLDVRYVTADGRKLDARRDVYVTLPGQFSGRWTPRAKTGGRAIPEQGVNIARQSANAAAAPEAAPVAAPPESSAPPAFQTDAPAEAAPPPETPRTARPEWSPYR